MFDLKKYATVQVATSLAILFHVIGLIGILYSSKPGFFISATAFHLVLMAGLVLFTEKKISALFMIIMISMLLAGFLAEWIGVHTAVLFGNYSYGNGLGWKWMGIPLIIGINWWMTVYGAGNMMEFVWQSFTKKSADLPQQASVKMISFLIDGALLATFFDWIMEPVAIRLGYWSWQAQSVPPFYNYVCWFLISLLMLIPLRKHIQTKPNRFAVHLFMIQLTYFLLLRISL